MDSQESVPTGWYRNRLVWVVVILLATVGGVVVLTNFAGAQTEPDLRGQILTRMRVALEQADPAQHNHADHNLAAVTGEDPTVVCGVHVYGHEPAEATELADVETVYGFHLCGVAGPSLPWDVAPKLAGPLIMDWSTEPPGIQVVEATEDTFFIDRLREMFPAEYFELASQEALPASEMADLRRRYDDAAGL
jgi:hypothetical protein